jgi:hypothetical protein
MNKRTAVIAIEGKTYDITLNDDANEALANALEELKTLGESISAKKLLEAYLNKAVLAAKLQTELRAIESAIATVNA